MIAERYIRKLSSNQSRKSSRCKKVLMILYSETKLGPNNNEGKTTLERQ